MSDVIEDLPGTRILECKRVPLALLAEFQSRRGTSIPEDPKKAFFTTKYGLFMTVTFKNELLPQLEPRPAAFLGSGWLFVWTLKVAARWREAAKDFTAMKEPLPWHLPPAVAEWQASGDVTSFIPSDHGALFLMRGKAAAQSPVSFVLDKGFRHPIWQFDTFSPTEELCPPGQVFLSIG
ncbi:MAG: hypothetical protein WA082_02435 [Candidatus Moraniibacteriota bacterium]